ncbi:hypothetical protein VTL71DRAFT_12168 [Oculimacula yallundae]|uniref:Uncharacterized protein n=1 Tax=Oculimacula yallundae TaxID=86028 RepID=A0ABR4CS88_9HELO
MKATTVSGVLAVLLIPITAILVERAGCNADNCARAATGLAGGKQSARLAACSSFQQCTVYPATVTITATATSNPVPLTQTATVLTLTQVTTASVTVTVSPAQKRDSVEFAGIIVPQVQNHGRAVDSPSATTICPSSVPATASACSGSVRFASACSCASITKSYVTLTIPSTTTTVASVAEPGTVTIPVTASTTTTTTVTSIFTSAPASRDPFFLQAWFPSGSEPASAQYRYRFISTDNGIGQWSMRDQQDIPKWIQFIINNAGELVNAGSTGIGSDFVAVAVSTSSVHAIIVWITRAAYQAAGVSFPFTTCTVVPSILSYGATAVLCNAAGKTVPAICDPDQWISMGGAYARADAFVVFFTPGATHAGCYPFELVQGF